MKKYETILKKKYAYLDFKKFKKRTIRIYCIRHKVTYIRNKFVVTQLNLYTPPKKFKKGTTIVY